MESFRLQAEEQVKELTRAIEAAESVIVSSIERECEALRSNQLLAAWALRLRLRDASKLYVNLIRAVRASMWTIEQVLPGTAAKLEARREAFGALLRVELAVLAAERVASGRGPNVVAAAPIRAKGRAKRTLRRRRMLGRREAS